MRDITVLDTDLEGMFRDILEAAGVMGMEVATKGGEGSGWFAPPKGTHGPGSQGGETLGKQDPYANINTSGHMLQALKDAEKQWLEEPMDHEEGLAVGDWIEGAEVSGVVEMDRASPIELEFPLEYDYTDGVATHYHPRVVPKIEVTDPETGEYRTVDTIVDLEGGVLPPPSPSDFVAAVNENLAEMRVVGHEPDGTKVVYRIIRGGGLDDSQWPPGYEMADELTDAFNSQVREVRGQAVSRYGPTYTSEEIGEIARISAEQMHQYWIDMASLFNFGYERVEV